MKVCILTNELTENHGMGRYSMDIIRAFLANEVDVVVAIKGDGVNETGLHALKILLPPLKYSHNYFLAFWYAWRLRSAAKDCDIIHSFIEPYSYIAYWISKLTGKKYFVTSHGTYGVLPYSFPVYKRYFHKKSFECAERVICVSNYTKKRLEEFSLNNLSVINNGIDFDKFPLAPTPDFEKQENIILGVGALKYRKGYHISIPAFALAKKVLPDLKYKIVGNQKDVSYFTELKNLAKKYAVAGDIEFISGISDEELKGLYRKAKIFVLTSCNHDHYFEGFGLVYLEAASAGLPVIGTLGSGIEDAVKNGHNGILVPQNDINKTSAAILDILSDKDKWRTMSKHSYEWAKDHDLKKVVRKYISLYEETLSR